MSRDSVVVNAGLAKIGSARSPTAALTALLDAKLLRQGDDTVRAAALAAYRGTLERLAGEAFGAGRGGRRPADAPSEPRPASGALSPPHSPTT